MIECSCVTCVTVVVLFYRYLHPNMSELNVDVTVVVFVLQIFTTKQLEDDLSKIANVLSNDKADWELRVTAVSTENHSSGLG